ncbi:hypothetical protein GN244_ATG12085 [Phytophthora infestans]|uniref:Uncharacterized protein n=1 Tax=Phytophthora infestans TaxID=4787 RepID=A0A833VZT8_PHYIN|nr:hypothetical protein GN244_ATG12085 [Phytophthora infestans]
MANEVIGELEDQNVHAKRSQRKNCSSSIQGRRPHVYDRHEMGKLNEKLICLKDKYARLEKKLEDERAKYRILEFSSTRLYSELIATRDALRGGWGEGTSGFTC